MSDELKAVTIGCVTLLFIVVVMATCTIITDCRSKLLTCSTTEASR